MALREESKTINEHKYYVRQLPPTKALPLKFKLTKILGAALPSLLTGKEKPSATEEENNENKNKQAEAFGRALESLFSVINPDEMMELIKTVIETATRDGKRIMDGGGDQVISFDDAFQDSYQEMYQVLFFVLEVNFGNFIKGFGLDLETIKKKVKLN